MAAQKPLSSGRLLIVSFGTLIGPVGMAFVATLAPTFRAQYDWPTWVGIARTISLLWISWAVFALITTPRNLRKKEVADKIRRSGGDPEQLAFIVGSACALAPACAGVLLAVAGAPLWESYLYCAGSMIAFPVFWWRNRILFWRPSAGDHPSRYSRSYTYILMCFGALYCLGALLQVSTFQRISSAWTPERAVLLSAGLVLLLLGIGCIGVGWLRLRGNPIARPATSAVSWLLLAFVPLGTLTSLYWFIWVRRWEEANVDTTAAAS